MKKLYDDNLTLEEAEELIRNGEDVKKRLFYNRTPLHYIKNADIAQLLIDHGADVNALDDDHETPLFTANHAGIIQVLISNGADVHWKNIEGRTVLHKINSLSTVKLLIENGADVNATDIYGWTPLFSADSDIAKLLIHSGANVNILADQNYTPLSIQRINEDDIVTLIKHGAVPGTIAIYKHRREKFSPEQQKAFDMFIMLTTDDTEFFHMCLAYQEGVKNDIKIKEIDIV